MEAKNKVVRLNSPSFLWVKKPIKLIMQNLLARVKKKKNGKKKTDEAIFFSSNFLFGPSKLLYRCRNNRGEAGEEKQEKTRTKTILSRSQKGMNVLSSCQVWVIVHALK